MFSLRTRLAVLAGAAALAAAIVVPASPAEAQSNCNFSEGQACYLQNVEGFYAAGDTHGKTVGTDNINGTRYVYRAYEASGGLTYGYITNTADTLCWNLDTSLNEIGMDSCPAGDPNEMFAMVPCADGSWCINSLDDGGNYKLYGNVNDMPLFFFPAVNKYSEWDALTST
jgi:hypothetical protein